MRLGAPGHQVHQAVLAQSTPGWLSVEDVWRLRESAVYWGNFPAHMTRAARLVAVIALLTTMFMPSAAANSVASEWAAPRTVYIAATGQSIDGLFLDLWRTGGGAATFGNPVTPELVEADDKVIQYYEYARLEYWPNGDTNGNYVVLGNIGRELGPPLLRRFSAGFNARSSAILNVNRAWLPINTETSERLAAEEPSYRYIASTRHGVWGGFRSYWEATGETAFLGNPISEEYISGGVSYQVFERGKLQWSPGQNISLVPLGALLARQYRLDMSRQPQGNTPAYDESLFVPPVIVPMWDAAPPAPSGGRAVVVSLSQQALWAYEDGAVIRSTFVSTGTAKTPTPAGYFSVINKIPMQDMEGTIGGESYFVADVPNVMYFDNDGNALHGTYWHNNFGAPMSHGCVNLPLDVAAWMYEWAPMGMPVMVID